MTRQDLILKAKGASAPLVDERDVEFAVRQWMGGQVYESRLGSLSPATVEYTRNQIRQFFQLRKTERMQFTRSLDEAITAVRQRCESWSPAQYMYWMRWFVQMCDWPAQTPGWSAKLVDAVADDLPRESLGPAVLVAWKMSLEPQQHLSTSRWRELFDLGGYVEDQERATRPQGGPVVLYRGSSWDARANWSWSSRFVIAEWFKNKFDGPRMVWVALVPQENILARARHRWGEKEIVVDTMRKDRPGFTIPIRPLDMWVRDRHWPGCPARTAGRCPECGAVVKTAGPLSRAPLPESAQAAFYNRRVVDLPWLQGPSVPDDTMASASSILEAKGRELFGQSGRGHAPVPDGWARCGLGHKHWGVNGGAGLMLVRTRSGRAEILMQRRAASTSDGGTWGIPGGARDGHETPVQAALREAAEEAGISSDVVRMAGMWRDDHHGWEYVTVFATTVKDVELHANAETAELRWVPADEVGDLDLHPGFARTWPDISAMLP